MNKIKDINKLIHTKIKDYKTSSPEVKGFLFDIISFERDYFNEDMNRYSSQYRKYIDFHCRKIKGDK